MTLSRLFIYFYFSLQESYMIFCSSSRKTRSRFNLSSNASLVIFIFYSYFESFSNVSAKWVRPSSLSWEYKDISWLMTAHCSSMATIFCSISSRRSCLWALKSILQFKRIITIIKLCSYLTSPKHDKTSGLFLQAMSGKKWVDLWKVSSINKYENYITGEEVLARTYILKIEALRQLII